jgi:hypothetical protein
MEYVAFHGVYADLPVDKIFAAWEKAYGKDRVRNWIKRFEEGGERSLSNFEREEVLDK